MAYIHNGRLTLLVRSGPELIPELVAAVKQIVRNGDAFSLEDVKQQLPQQNVHLDFDKPRAQENLRYALHLVGCKFTGMQNDEEIYRCMTEEPSDKQQEDHHGQGCSNATGVLPEGAAPNN